MMWSHCKANIFCDRPRVLAIASICAGFIAAVTVIMAATDICASAAPPDAVNDSENAATFYNRAFDLLDKNMTRDDAITLGNYFSDPGQSPSPDLVALLNRIRPAIDLARQAGLKGYCDFNYDYSRGMNLMMPQLGQMRRLSNLLRVDTYASIASGDSANAAKNIAAMYHITGSLTDCRTLVSSSFAAQAILQNEQLISALAGSGNLTPEAAEIIRNSAQSLDPDDPAQVANAVVMERDLVAGPFDAEFHAISSGKTEDVSAFLDNVLGPDSQTRDLFRNMTLDQIRADIGQYKDAMDECSKAFAMDDPVAAQAKLKELMDQADRGDFGKLAKSSIFYLNSDYLLMSQSRDQLRARMETLDKIAGGGKDDADAANAAAWYLRAIHAINTDLDASTIAAIDQFTPNLADKPFQPREGQPVPDYDHDLTSIVQILREGSEVRRCDFTMGTSRRDDDLLPPYVQGMHQCLNALLLDAHQLVRQNKVDDALERLTIAIGIIHHLSGDDLLVSSAVGQTSWNRLVQLAAQDASVIDAGVSPQACRSALFAARLLNQQDPFGNSRSASASRSLLEVVLPGLYLNPDTKSVIKNHLAPILKDAKPDALLSYLIFYQSSEQGGNPAEILQHRLGDIRTNSAHLMPPLVNLPDLVNLAQSARPFFFSDITWPRAAFEAPSGGFGSAQPDDKGNTTSTATTAGATPDADLKLIGAVGREEPDTASFALPPLLNLDEMASHAKTDFHDGLVFFESLARKHPIKAAAHDGSSSNSAGSETGHAGTEDPSSGH